MRLRGRRRGAGRRRTHQGAARDGGEARRAAGPRPDVRRIQEAGGAARVADDGRHAGGDGFRHDVAVGLVARRMHEQRRTGDPRCGLDGAVKDDAVSDAQPDGEAAPTARGRVGADHVRHEAGQPWQRAQPVVEPLAAQTVADEHGSAACFAGGRGFRGEHGVENDAGVVAAVPGGELGGDHGRDGDDTPGGADRRALGGHAARPAETPSTTGRHPGGGHAVTGPHDVAAVDGPEREPHAVRREQPPRRERPREPTSIPFQATVPDGGCAGGGERQRPRTFVHIQVRTIAAYKEAIMIGTNLGRYRIEAELGRGGMSVVYRAHDPVLGRAVALKVLHPHLADRREARERFTREARAVARLAHPHIVEVYDYAPPDAERAYIVTEFIDGPTLRAFVDEHPVARAEVAALLMIPVFDALQHAHQTGIVHRDVKPENIMLGPEGTPVLMDFGIAQMVDTETLTATGMILGSPAHMAPEVVEGEEAGPPADVFSAGTVLYWLVCGALPFTGPSPAALFRRILESRFDPVLQRRPHAGRALARIIEHCLQRSPDARPGSAREVAEALRALLAEAGLTDLAAERAAFWREPAVYQEALGRRVLPAYLASARRALDGGLTARALDFLDRVLALDERHPEALALLDRIERGQRRWRTVRRAALAVAGAALVGGIAGTIRLFTEPPAPVPDAAVAAATDAAPPDAALALAVPDAATPDAAVVARAPDAAPRPLERPRPAVASAPPVEPSRPEVPSTASVPPPAPVRLDVRADQKNGRIFVDGVLHAEVWEIDSRAKPVVVPPGRHVVRFEHPACEPDEERVEVVAGDDRRRPVLFRCRWLPAYFEVRSNKPAEVRDAATGQILGRTNQEIPFPMRHQRASLTLTIQGSEGSVMQRVLALVAGQKHAASVEF